MADFNNLKKAQKQWSDVSKLTSMLECAILRADRSWVKQIFARFIKLERTNNLLYLFPELIAKTCYYKFYPIMISLQNDSSVKNMWNCLNILTTSKKALDAKALAFALTLPQDFITNKDLLSALNTWLIPISGDLLPETLDVLPFWPVSYNTLLHLKAMEVLLQVRRVPAMTSLHVLSTRDEPSGDLPIHYWIPYGSNLISTKPDFSDIMRELSLCLDTTVNFFSHYVDFFYYCNPDNIAELSHSIEPFSEDYPVDYTNCYLYLALLENMASILDLTWQQLHDFINREYPCGLARAYDLSL